ncbi:MAG: acetylornithine deacetylase [Parvibaculaceae bacterium]
MGRTSTDILKELVGFASVSADSNLDIIAYIEARLASLGIASRRIADRTGRKASLLATVGPSDRAGVVLSAHTDVVPAEEPDWSSPPFVATVREGRLYGRGACDMKGFIAAVLAQLPALRQGATETPVHLAFSYDEEVGCRGAPDLVAEVAGLPARPVLCIVGEPSSLEVATAHKGKVAYRVTIKGRTGHSALPHRAANALLAGARIAARLGDIAEETASAGRRDDAFDPPYTTVHVGSLHGGSALNLVPDRAVLEYEIRNIPDRDGVPALLARIDAGIAAEREKLRRSAPEADILIEEIAAYPQLGTPADHRAVGMVARLAGAQAGVRTVSFGTEAGLYAEAGIPTVICGPGDMTRAHRADEWIGLDELAAAERMLERLASKLGRPAANWTTA